MQLKPFQNKAIDQLNEKFKLLWGQSENNLRMKFFSPTGSGKTVMMAEFIRSVKSNLIGEGNNQMCYIWVSIGGSKDESLIKQSYRKFKDLYNDGVDMNLMQLEDINYGSELTDNSILFINWNILKASDKKNRIIRRENEKSDISLWDDFLKKTKRFNRKIILVIDESQKEMTSDLANEIIGGINPKIIIEVSATHRSDFNPAVDVKVNEQDVIDSGLIKQQILFQTDEDIQKINNLSNLSQNEKMLELAYRKRLEILKQYSEIKVKINPLIMIQLPNDVDDYETEGTSLINEVKNFLNKKVKQEYCVNKKYEYAVNLEDHLAIWLSGEHENLDIIVHNDSPIDYLIFKQAAATGWDCPRASILVMFREIHDPVFHTQVLGRIRRTAEQKIYKSSILNSAYVYTNYRKNDITSQYINEKNKAKVNFAKRKDNIDFFSVVSEYIGRTDYNTLVSEENKWQDIFINVANNYFGTPRGNVNKNYKNFIKKNGELNNNLQNQIITNAKVINTDNVVIGGKNIDFDLSKIDIEKTYDYLCYKVLKEQSESAGIYNAARSKSPLKKAINVYFRKILGLNISEQYRAIINELSNNDSHLNKVITIALKEFRPFHDGIVKERERQSQSEIEIPPCEIGFTDEYKRMDVNKNAYDIFYVPKVDKSEGNEPQFIDFIDNHKNVKWWHKQNDHGKEYFSIKYKFVQEADISGSNALFYPDWIIEDMSGQIWILDTKRGKTSVATNSETRDKKKALDNWLKQNQKFKGGIVEPDRLGNWYLIKKVNDDGTGIVKEKLEFEIN